MNKSVWFNVCALAGFVMASSLSMAEVKVDPNLTVDKSRITKRSAGPSYNYVGFQYVNQRLDWNPSCTQDGFEVYGSLDIKEGFFAVANLGDVSGNRCGSSRVAAGGGYRTDFDDQFDMFATVQFESISPDDAGSDSGLMITGGLRGFISKEIEGVLALHHSTTFDGNTGISAGGRFWFKPNLGATVDVGVGSDVNIFQLGVRYNF